MSDRHNETEERAARLRRSLYTLQRESGHLFVEQVAQMVELRDDRIRQLGAALREAGAAFRRVRK